VKLARAWLVLYYDWDGNKPISISTELYGFTRSAAHWKRSLLAWPSASRPTEIGTAWGGAL